MVMGWWVSLNKLAFEIVKKEENDSKVALANPQKSSVIRRIVSGAAYLYDLSSGFSLGNYYFDVIEKKGH